MSNFYYEQNIQDIAQFYMPHDPEHIPRICKSDSDCAINAFEILNILDHKKSSELRQYLTNRKNIKGLTLDELITIINNEAYSRKIDYNFFVKQVDIQHIIKYLSNNLLPNHAIFLLFGVNKLGHIILVAKDNNHQLTIIDLQERFIYCPLQNNKCIEYLQDKNKNYWGVIAYKQNTIFFEDTEMMLDDSDIYGFGFGIGSISSVLSAGKSALQQANKLKAQVSQFKAQASQFKAQASQLKDEAKAQAVQLKKEATQIKEQATQLKDEANAQATQLKAQATQLKDEANAQATQLKAQATQLKEEAIQLKEQAVQQIQKI
jgi:gas vesicle protein